MAGWTCMECEAGEESDNFALMDRAAERHGKDAHHGTRTWTTGAARVRDGERVRDLKPGAVAG